MAAHVQPQILSRPTKLTQQHTSGFKSTRSTGNQRQTRRQRWDCWLKEMWFTYLTTLSENNFVTCWAVCLDLTCHTHAFPREKISWYFTIVFILAYYAHHSELIRNRDHIPSKESWGLTAWLGKHLCAPLNPNPAVTKNTPSQHWCNLSDINDVPVAARMLRVWETVWQTTVMPLRLTVWQAKAFISLRLTTAGLYETHRNEDAPARVMTEARIAHSAFLQHWQNTECPHAPVGAIIWEPKTMNLHFFSSFFVRQPRENMSRIQFKIVAWLNYWKIGCLK